jgi:hypothetical protein
VPLLSELTHFMQVRAARRIWVSCPVWRTSPRSALRFLGVRKSP